MTAVRDVLTEIGLNEANYESKSDSITMRFDTTSTTTGGRIRAKIEINIREVNPRFAHHTIPYTVDNPWFGRSADVLTFELDEMLGTKLRALHQRRKGRDLFDLWLGLTHLDTDPDRIIEVFDHYLEQSGVQISPADFAESLGAKLTHRGFLTDLAALVANQPVGYTPETAADLIRQKLLTRMR